MSKGRLRQSLVNWANNERRLAEELRVEYADKDVDTIAGARDREIVRLRGTLRTVTLRPRGGVPALEAELFDGSGVVTVVWLGRRRIAGIVPGRSIQVQGRIGQHDGTRILYNPHYELMVG